MILDERLKLGSTRNGHVQRFGCEKTFRVEQIEEVAIDQIGEQLIGQTIQRGHLGQRQIPFAVSRTIYISATRLMLIKHVNKKEIIYYCDPISGWCS